MKVVSPREGSISNIRTFLKANIDTQNDAMFEAGDTFSKPSFFGIYVRFRRSAVYIYLYIYIPGSLWWHLSWLEHTRNLESHYKRTHGFSVFFQKSIYVLRYLYCNCNLGNMYIYIVIIIYIYRLPQYAGRCWVRSVGESSRSATCHEYKTILEPKGYW